MNYASIRGKNGPVTRTVPGSVGVVPRHDATFMGARRRYRMGFAVIAFPHSNLTPAEVHDGTAASLDFVEAVNK
jgi:hypothetical protein